MGRSLSVVRLKLGHCYGGAGGLARRVGGKETTGGKVLGLTAWVGDKMGSPQ